MRADLDPRLGAVLGAAVLTLCLLLLVGPPTHPHGMGKALPQVETWRWQKPSLERFCRSIVRSAEVADCVANGLAAERDYWKASHGKGDDG